MEFKVDDIVYDIETNLIGVVIAVDITHSYPLEIKFDTGCNYYTNDGRWSTNGPIVLFHASNQDLLYNT